MRQHRIPISICAANDLIVDVYGNIAETGHLSKHEAIYQAARPESPTVEQGVSSAGAGAVSGEVRRPPRLDHIRARVALQCKAGFLAISLRAGSCKHAITSAASRGQVLLHLQQQLVRFGLRTVAYRRRAALAEAKGKRDRERLRALAGECSESGHYQRSRFCDTQTIAGRDDFATGSIAVVLAYVTQTERTVSARRDADVATHHAQRRQLAGLQSELDKFCGCPLGAQPKAHPVAG